MNTVIIDKGNKDGVKSNMVMTEGLVGRVTKVNQFSQVDLLSTNTRTGKLSVNIQHDSKMYLV